MPLAYPVFAAEAGPSDVTAFTMAVGIGAEQALGFDHSLHSYGVWAQQFDRLVVVSAHDFQKLVGFWVQATSVQRDKV